MNITSSRRRWNYQPVACALLGMALLLSGCAAGASSAAHGQPSASPSASSPNSSTATPSPSSGLLSCAVADQPRGVDTVTILLTCAVHGAPASATSFTLTYALKSSSGTRALTPACAGALSGGHGSCSQRYTIPVIFDLGKGAVTGALQPDQQPLGPLTPTPAPAPAPTPIGSPIPYVFPTPSA